MRLAAPALGWLAGVAAQLQLAQAWPATACVVLLAAAAAAWPWRRHAAVVAAVAAVGGFGIAGLHAQARLSQALPVALEGRDLQLVGVIDGLPRVQADGTRFVFRVESATHEGAPAGVPPRISLGWYRPWHEEGAATGPQASLRAGERWRFTARLKRPHGSVNPHGFDHELYLFERGMRAVGHVRGDAARLHEAAGAPIERLRQHVRDAIAAHVADDRAAGVLAALAVGDQAAIERADWDLFRATGVAHLMSISGLHVTMFAWLAGAVIGAAWRRSARCMLWRPAPVAARWGGLVAAVAYAGLAGWGVPAQRTVWMLATAAVLAGLGLRWPWPLVLLAAAVVVTALDPWALLQPGFWLSFVAVGLLMASAAADPPPPAAGLRSRFALMLRGGLRTQCVATVGLAPLTLVFFQQVSLVGFVANLVAIPLVTLAVTPLALIGALAAPAWSIGAVLLQALSAGLAALAAWPGAVWVSAAAPAWAQAGGLAAGALLVMPLQWRLKLLALPLLAPLLWPALPRPEPGRFELLAADVGQGTAVLVRTRDHLLLYDAGPQYGRDADAGQRVLVPLLRVRGERRVDLLVLSHRDQDHVGGAAALLDAVTVTAMLGSLEPGHPLRGRGVPFEPCTAGRRWAWDGVRFETLHPPADAPASKANASSCVLKVSDAAGRSALLTGDIEAAQEAALVRARAADLPSDVLLVPHHGSRTSSSAAFLDAVAPATALVQAGYRNRFGHPAADVVARHAERGIDLVRSDRCGAWTWRGDEGRCERRATRRYWRHDADATGQR